MNPALPKNGNLTSDVRKGGVKKAGILSLGCPRNLTDSEHLLGKLKKSGYSIVDIAEAEVAFVNTCAFIEDAKAESIEALLDLIELKKEGKLKKIIACGCLVQRYKDVLEKEFPEIDVFTGTFAFEHSLDRFPITPGHYAYLKICESCLSSCSFCIIPKIKGKFSSINIESLVKEAKQLEKSGIKELNIIGQDTSSYGLDLYTKRKLPELLQAILKGTKSIPWIRLLYLYPDIKTIKALLDIMQDEPRVCRYIDLPLQHINNRILKLMRRRSNKEEILEIIALIRKNLPDAAIRTSFIVGFPSESEKEFQELMHFIEEVKFERLGVFTYSREEGTPAYNFKGQLPEATKLARLNAVMSRQQGISIEVYRRMMTRKIDVLIDEAKNNTYLGRSRYDAPEVDGTVYVKSERSLKPGDLVNVEIKDTLEYDLIGEVKK